MTTTEATDETAGERVLDGAEAAVSDLLAGLRIQPGNNEMMTVLDWLDRHGVLDDVDTAAHKIAAETEAAEAEKVAAESAPVDVPTAVPAGGADTSASGDVAAVTPPAPIEPTASSAAEVVPPKETLATRIRGFVSMGEDLLKEVEGL